MNVRRWKKTLPVLLFVCGFLMIPVSVRADIPLQEREALVALYNSTNGNNWTNKTNWLGPPGTECDWHGITCNSPVETIILTASLEGMPSSSGTITINFDLAIIGLSNIRALTQGTFNFNWDSGSDIPRSLTADLNNAFTAWYHSEESRPYGSVFRLVVPVTVQGDISAISSISVTLTNPMGASVARSVNF